MVLEYEYSTLIGYSITDNSFFDLHWLLYDYDLTACDGDFTIQMELCDAIKALVY